MKTILIILLFTGNGSFQKVQVVSEKTLSRCEAIRDVLNTQTKNVTAVCVQYEEVAAEELLLPL